MQIRDGKVVDMTALTDSISLNELLERVQPPAHVT
jgi:ketosteroid isomerase-like protein